MARAAPAEKVTFATYPEIPGVEFMSGIHVADSFDPHMHEAVTIGVTIEGSERFFCRGGDHVAKAGQIALLNPFEVHEGGPGPEGWWTYRMLYLGPGVLESVSAQLVPSNYRGTPRFPCVMVEDPELAEAIGILQNALDHADSPLERQSLLLNVLGMVTLRHSTAGDNSRQIGREPAAISKVRDYLQTYFAEAVSLQDLSQVAALSPFHLLRTFRRNVGMPPHAYLRQIRVEKAKAMLAAGTPISEAAIAVGFADQSHLNRYFKRILGLTPGAYVAAILSKTTEIGRA